MDTSNVSNVILRNISTELQVIAQKGLSSSNLDIAYKLIEMQYRLLLISKLDAYESDYDYDYQNAKKHYRTNRCEGSKSEVIECLKRKVSEMEEELQALWIDADFSEEREIIKKYLSKIGG